VSYDPIRVYGHSGRANGPVAMFISPSQYIQGKGVLDRIGAYLRVLTPGPVGVLLTRGRAGALGQRIRDSLRESGLRCAEEVFGGECSDPEVSRLLGRFQEAGGVRLLVGVGGGKCLDAARMVAHRLGVPAAACPTIAATDAPTAAHSVVYSPEGAFLRVEYHATNPVLVLADVEVIAAAPVRFLVSGLGDALSTFYEARSCARNPLGLTVRGVRPTAAALAVAELCARITYEHGPEAVAQVRSGSPGEALDRVIEANILLSGLGFENGGLAAAHAVAQGLTGFDRIHRDFYHGEMVALGTLAQLALEQDLEDAARAAGFFRDVGLPCHFGQLGLDLAAGDAMERLIGYALRVEFMRNMPFEVTPDRLRRALGEADRLGRCVAGAGSTERFLALHPGPGG